MALAVIAGPTASGKSALALEWAEREGGVLVNADASQVYRDLSILSARPSAEDEARVPHRLFGVLDGARSCSASDWAAMARAEVEMAHQTGRLPILVGGTGLYLRTLLWGIAPVPPVADDVRAEIRAMTAGAVRQALEAADPSMAARLHPNDRQRNGRALEVWRSTGRSLGDWQQTASVGGLGPLVQLRPLLLDPPVDQLGARIDARIDWMWQNGALDEVRRLAARRLTPLLPVMRAIGVPPLMALLAGDLDERQALERWRTDTRRYAKRQRTWFRHQTPDWPRWQAVQI